MYYLKSTPNAGGNYGNPQSNAFSDSFVLPDELLNEYISTKGFAILTVEAGTVTAVTVNQTALDIYNAGKPVIVPTAKETRRKAYTTGSVGETDWHITRDGEVYTCDQLTELGLQYEFRGETTTAEEIRSLVSAKIAEIRLAYPDEVEE